jgi:DHA3 family macrolide efflux protein-like MFS transporter
MISLLGSALVEFALAWYLTIKTGSATILATAVMVALLPQVILGPFIGPLIDRWNRKRIMIGADLAIALITVGLVLLFYFNAIQVWHIYVAMIIRAIGQSFHFPAMQATIPLIVPARHLVRISGLTQMFQGIINIAAPPAGALLLGVMPMQGVLSIDIITAAIAIACLAAVAIPKTIRTVGTAAGGVIKEMIQGFRYIWTWKGLRILIILSALLNLFMIPPFTLLPILVTTHLGGDVLKLGWLEAAFGVGVIIGGLILGAWGGFKKNMVTVLLGLAVAGVSTFVLGFTTLNLFILGVVVCFLIGAGLTFTNAPVIAIMQKTVTNDMQGRVFSLMGAIGAAATPLGLIIAGPLADSCGISILYFIAGAATLLLCLYAAFIPSVMNLGTDTDGKTNMTTPSDTEIGH